MTVEMELVGVHVQMPTNAPILLLRETAGDERRTVPIYIGGPEAHAIDLALSGTPTARPMTHDLFATVIDGWAATSRRSSSPSFGRARITPSNRADGSATSR